MVIVEKDNTSVEKFDAEVTENIRLLFVAFREIRRAYKAFVIRKAQLKVLEDRTHTQQEWIGARLELEKATEAYLNKVEQFSEQSDALLDEAPVHVLRAAEKGLSRMNTKD